jgi:hypothetical protein
MMRMARRPRSAPSRPEEDAALRRELRLFSDHAGGDGIDIWNELTAQPHRVRLAGLLLLRRVGEARARLRQYGQDDRKAENRR